MRGFHLTKEAANADTNSFHYFDFDWQFRNEVFSILAQINELYL